MMSMAIPTGPGNESAVSGSSSKQTDEAQLRGLYELTFAADPGSVHPFFDLVFRVSFTRPAGQVTVAEGFYDGGRTFRCRAYCDVPGTWEWRVSANVPGLADASGRFHVVPSALPGKLRIDPTDCYQFAYDNGSWFLHIGDTGYRYLSASESGWRVYLDQAVEMGATKIRTWFCEGRSDVRVLFADGRRTFNLAYWQEMDRRLLYALKAHPHVVFEVIPYGEDTEELRRYDMGDAASRTIAAYAQARFSALPNVMWCFSNDRQIVREEESVLEDHQVRASTIEQIGREMREREPWGTLLTNHQCRFSGYDFAGSSWSNVVTLEDIDQVHGRLLRDYRGRARAPIVNDEDRYETYRGPVHPRYFFRRLMWGSLLSGGHATYGGLRTYEPCDGQTQGMHGYFDACRDGRLQEGAHDFCAIHRFFRERDLTLVGMTPDDAICGDQPLRSKCIRDEKAVIVYLANPSGDTPETDDASDTPVCVSLEVPKGKHLAEWYNPVSGSFRHVGSVSAGPRELETPGMGDWVLLLRKA
ncbi:MAG: DUF4038 domain-containing protein [Chitinivibrionales bacterium]|nr:DUF4038 domain-containing protein [Chitinivibrionales bacterium]